MYADDIILLSSTAEGLQAKLDILDSYCNDWCLTVNPTKTKILVFNKAGRHLRHNFKYKACELECVQHCKYLGVYFSASGTFSYAQDELYKKSLKVYFKLQKDFLSQNQNQKLVYIYLITQSSPLYFMAVKYGALLTQIQLDLEMELYLRTEFTQILLVKNYILNFVNLF